MHIPNPLDQALGVLDAQIALDEHNEQQRERNPHYTRDAESQRLASDVAQAESREGSAGRFLRTFLT